MEIPVATNELTFLAASEPEPARDYKTREPTFSSDGRPYYQVEVVVMSDSRRADVWRIKVVGKPDGVTTGTKLKVTNVIAKDWNIKDEQTGKERHGINFTAKSIEVLASVSK